MMHSNSYLDEENGETKLFLEEITDDVNERKNIENDCILTKINNSNIKNIKTSGKLKFFRRRKVKHFKILKCFQMNLLI